MRNIFILFVLLVCVACERTTREGPTCQGMFKGASDHESNGPSQSMAGKKKYDMFKALIVSPEASFDDFVIVGYTQENTSMHEMSVYRNDPWVREHFLNEYGNFDESTFSRAYYVAKDYYKALGTANREQILESKRTYHRSNPDVPFERRRKGPDF